MDGVNFRRVNIVRLSLIISLYEMFIFCTFFISFKHDFHVNADSMIIRTRERSINN